MIRKQNMSRMRKMVELYTAFSPSSRTHTRPMGLVLGGFSAILHCTTKRRLSYFILDKIFHIRALQFRPRAWLAKSPANEIQIMHEPMPKRNSRSVVESSRVASTSCTALSWAEYVKACSLCRQSFATAPSREHCSEVQHVQEIGDT